MTVEPHNVRYMIGARVMPCDPPKKPRTTLTYAETCQLERRAAAARDRPGNGGGATFGNIQETLLRRTVLRQGLASEFGDARFCASDAGLLWGEGYKLSFSRLATLARVGMVNKHATRPVSWSVA